MKKTAKKKPLTEADQERYELDLARKANAYIMANSDKFRKPRVWTPDEESTSDRYYVQRMSANNFRVCEIQTPGSQPGSADVVVRTLLHADDADYFTNSMNELQQKLDKIYGKWLRRAATFED